MRAARTALVLAALLAAGCEPRGSAVIGTPAPPGAPGVTPVGGIGPPAGGTGTAAARDPQAQQAVDAALREASARLNAPAAQLSVERVEAREWRDTSLGCPQPGQMYAQVITPGYLVVVSGAGRRLEYHTDMRGRAVLCGQP
jgi:hypothetical protein